MTREREPLPTRVEDTPTLPAEYYAAVERGLTALGVALPPEARAVIDGHIRLLAAWTDAINLTAIREPAAMGLRHVVDSLAALPLLADPAPDRLLDLGSGGGFPGIPLAAALPGTSLTLLEPVAKKARFLAVVVAATGLDGRVAVRHDRAEALADGGPRGGGGAGGARRGDGSGGRRGEGLGARERGAGRDALAPFDVVTARAVALLADLVELAFPLLARGGRLVAWKRGHLADELAAADRAARALGGARLATHDLRVPGLADHQLVVATRTGTVPAGFPRDPAARRRRPW